MSDEKKEPVEPDPIANSVEEINQVPDTTDKTTYIDQSDSDELFVEEEEPGEDEQGTMAEAKYDLTTEAISGTQVVGDHAYVNINYYIQTIEKISQDTEDDSGTTPRKTEESIFGNQETLRQKYVDNLRQERENTFFLTSTAPSLTLPEDEESISSWYYKLDEYEQCYVQAAAILHGAPAHDVSVKADSLFKHFHEQQEVVLQPLAQGATSQEVQQRSNSYHFDLSQHRKPGRELRKRTHTVTQRVDGIERLFWQDVDTYGISNFGLRFLEFLAKEFTNRGEHGKNFLIIVEEWAKKVNDDYSLQAAHAYGVILWCQNVEQLRKTAESWAKGSSLASRRRAAALLDGAYEIDLILDQQRAENPKTSPVLQQLSLWTSAVMKANSQNEKLSISQAKIGCTAANAYGLIGKRSPEKALSGLELLLQLPDSRSTDNANNIFAAGVSVYVTLTWSGHIRLVLKHLAAKAELLSHQYKQPETLNKRPEYRRKREVGLNATFEAFFLVTGASISGAQESGIVFYISDAVLSANPQIPDPYGRDMLLAGLLSPNETEWRDQLMTLLCAIIIEKKSGPAFTLMRQWAETVLKMKEIKGSEACQKYRLARQILVEFMVKLGAQIDEWLRYRRTRKQRSPHALDAYKYKLEQWLKEGKLHGRPIGILASDVLKQLDR